MDAKELLTAAVSNDARDIFIVAGKQLSYKDHHSINSLNDEVLMPEQTLELITQIYTLANRDISLFASKGDDDFSFAIPGVSRFRANTYLQRGSYSAVIRVISFELPDPGIYHIPDRIVKLGVINKGMILVTGPAGSGKSTTLATMIDYINENYQKHIITLEDPIEFLHRHKKCIVSQREIHIDTENYVNALRASLRQSPDVILLGEMRDYDTINTAVMAAETGHMVISTLHTTSASKTIDRIIDVFPPSQQHQIAVQLSMILEAVVSQQLVPSVDGKLVPAFEIMILTPAIRNMIRENKIHQIDGMIATSGNENMVSMDQSLLNLYKDGMITAATAIYYANNPEMMKKKLMIK